MKSSTKKIDKTFLFLTGILVLLGITIFISASMGLLTSNDAKFQAVTFNQIVFGLIGGSISALILSYIDYRIWRKYAFYIFITAGVLMLLVFVPGLQFCTKGACRWIDAGPITFQPAEIYKIAFVMYTAAWFASVKQKVGTFKLGTIPFIILV